jgi:transcriptional regulator GlxA family with amidase domain
MLGAFLNDKKGYRLNNFKLRSRINQAKDLLRHSTLTFTAIAEECGFDSLATFSRAFRRYEKVSPSEYVYGPLNGKLADKSKP